MEYLNFAEFGNVRERKSSSREIERDPEKKSGYFEGVTGNIEDDGKQLEKAEVMKNSVFI